MAIEFEPIKRPKWKKETPLAYMLRIMNDPDVSDERRDRMASLAAPYCHSKMSWTTPSKKAAKTEAAKTAGMGSPWMRDLEQTSSGFEIRAS